MKFSLHDIEKWDRDHVWHPFTQMRQYAAERPLVIERAEGPWLIDAEGNAYLDAVSSLWCNVHGHRVPELDAALRDQLDHVAHSTLLGVTNVPAVLLARKLVELAPTGLNRVFFSDNGSTAVEVALKMAFQFWQQCRSRKTGKAKFLAIGSGYHGDTVGSTSLGGIARFHEIFGPLLFPTLKAPPPYCYRCPLGLERSTCRIDCVGELERLVRENCDDLAAVVLEPLVQGAGGMIVAPEGYLRRVRAVTRECNVLLIADEVAVGFGRTGTMFACEREHVTPDFLCVAKGLTGGYLPLAATLTTDEVFEAFLGQPQEGKTFYHGHTYTGNPLAAAVALANLNLIESGQLLANIPGRTAHLRQRLERLAAHPLVGDVRQVGMMAGIELVQNKETKEPFPPELQIGATVCRHARRAGVLLRPLGDIVVVMPPLNIEYALIDQICDAIEFSLGELRANL